MTYVPSEAIETYQSLFCSSLFEACLNNFGFS